MATYADGTLSHLDETAPSPAAAPHLFLELECDRPLAPSICFSLVDVDEVLVGRGPDRAHERLTEGAIRRLHLRLPDGWLSSRHARLTRQSDRWALEDLGSKNGTLVNGIRCAGPVPLAEGAIVEMGHAIFFYRDAAARLEGGAPDQPADRIQAPIPELPTFLQALAHQMDGLARVAPRADVAVLISGESGTGKELVARALHRESRRPGDFVAVNCGSLPSNLLEAELFGYRRGAFSGATEDRLGLVRAASGGTLFLDEIGDLSMPSQVTLLRVLQEKEVLPLGATKPVPVDLRLVAATHRDLPALVDSSQFRADLYARLTGFRVHLPPLHQRREDLGLLIASILRRTAPEPARTKLTCRAARALFLYAWPLNIRELEKCLTTAVALAGDAPVNLPHLPDEVRLSPQPQTVTPRPAELSDEDRRRREHLVALLREHQGNVTRVANAMGKAAMQIHRWARKYGIDLAALRK